jgi:hypothetical protein
MMFLSEGASRHSFVQICKSIAGCQKPLIKMVGRAFTLAHLFGEGEFRLYDVCVREESLALALAIASSSAQLIKGGKTTIGEVMNAAHGDQEGQNTYIPFSIQKSCVQGGHRCLLSAEYTSSHSVKARADGIFLATRQENCVLSVTGRGYIVLEGGIVIDNFTQPEPGILVARATLLPENWEIRWQSITGSQRLRIFNPLWLSALASSSVRKRISVSIELRHCFLFSWLALSRGTY